MAKSDSMRDEDILRELQQGISDWDEAYEDQRQRSAKTERYYHGDQWTEEQRKELKRRGQPEVTINLLADEVDYATGTEISSRISAKAYPRSGEAHETDNKLATDATRYVLDKEQFDSKRTEVFEDQILAGMGGILVEIEPTLKRGREIVQEIRLREVDWDRLIWDPHSRKPDFSDAMWLGIAVWWDSEEAKKDPWYKGKEDIVDQAINRDELDQSDTLQDVPGRNTLWSDRANGRVQIFEIYFKKFEMDKRTPEAKDLGLTREVWYLAHICSGGYLYGPEKVPHVDEHGDNYCPLPMVTGLVDRDGTRYGPIERLISPQDEVNQRRSAAMHLIRAKQIFFEEGAVLNPREARAELMKPDGMIKVRAGAMKDGSFQVGDNTQLAASQASLMQEAKGDIDRLGPHSGILQRDPQSQQQESGRLFIARQEDAGRKMKRVKDRLRTFTLEVIRIVWLMIRQYKTEEWWFRVTDDKEKQGYRFVGANRNITRAQRLQELLEQDVPLKGAFDIAFGENSPVFAEVMKEEVGPRVQEMAQEAEAAQQQGAQIPPPSDEQVDAMITEALLNHPEAQKQIAANNLAELDMDIVLETAPSSIVVQHEEFRELVNLATSRVVPVPPEAIIRASTLRDKKAILEAMQPPEPDPMQQQQIALQLQAMQSQIEMLQAQIEETRTKAVKNLADARAVQYEPDKDQAQAWKYAVEAGKEAAPEEPEVDVSLDLNAAAAAQRGE